MAAITALAGKTSRRRSLLAGDHGSNEANRALNWAHKRTRSHARHGA
jgi:hypothetical protein